MTDIPNTQPDSRDTTILDAPDRMVSARELFGNPTGITSGWLADAAIPLAIAWPASERSTSPRSASATPTPASSWSS